METMESETVFPKIISVDDHTVEPPNVWQDRLPKKYRDIGPRIVHAPLKEMTFLGGRFRPVMGAPGDDGPIGDWWVYEDLHRPLTRLDTAVGYSRDEIKLEIITFEQMRPGSYDVEQRLADMDVNHVQSAVMEHRVVGHQFRDGIATAFVPHFVEPTLPPLTIVLSHSPSGYRSRLL